MPEFEIIYKEYYQRVYAFLYRLCDHRDLAEELTQETFYQAFTSMHRYQGNSDIFTWLASIAKHCYYKYLKKHKQDLHSANLDMVADLICDNDDVNPEIAVQKRDIAETVRGIVNDMPEKYREAVILRIYADLSFAQVAKAMNITENSAKVLYFRAKKMVMEALKHAYEM